MLKFLAIFCAAVYVASGEFCGSGDTYQYIYRVGTNTCPCTADNRGALRYQNNILEICDGSEYVAIGGNKGGLGTKDEPAESCREILKENPDAKSGMYFLMQGSGAEKAFCYMDKLCGEKGWTMILKADGHKNTFSYDSLLWSNQDTITSGAAGGLSEEETKLHTYHTFAFDRLCIGIKTKQSRRWQKLNVASDSLYSLIKGGIYHPTTIGRKAWKELIPQSSLQRNCNKEGFNVRINNKKEFTRIRIGIISNQENDCNTPDSRIGIGGAGTYCGQDGSNSVGNTAKCHGDNGDKNIKSFGYIFAAKPPTEGELGTYSNPASSCKEIMTKRSNAKNGIYFVKVPHKIAKMYCVMSKACGSTGWSLVMKLDGRKETFLYDSKYWKNKEIYQAGAINGGLDKQEMKLDSYHLLPFHDLCVGMKEGNNNIRWLKIPQKAESLYSLIADGKYRKTNLGKNAWKKLLKSASLQHHCNKEGFNVYHVGARARIGIISNQENDCNSPDSRIAFGGQGGWCGQNDKHSVGNEARCGADKGDKSVTAFGYILVK